MAASSAKLKSLTLVLPSDYSRKPHLRRLWLARLANNLKTAVQWPEKGEKHRFRPVMYVSTIALDIYTIICVGCKAVEDGKDEAVLCECLTQCTDSRTTPLYWTCVTEI